MLLPLLSPPPLKGSCFPFHTLLRHYSDVPVFLPYPRTPCSTKAMCSDADCHLHMLFSLPNIFFLLFSPPDAAFSTWTSQPGCTSAKPSQTAPSHCGLCSPLCLLFCSVIISFMSVPARYCSPLTCLPTLRCRTRTTCYPFFCIPGGEHVACHVLGTLEIPYERMGKPSATNSRVHEKHKFSLLEILESFLLQ